MMLTISPLLTLILILTLPLSFIVDQGIARRGRRRILRAQQKELGDLNGHVEEMFTGHRVVKAFGHERNRVAKFDEMNERLVRVRLEGAIRLRHYHADDELDQQYRLRACQRRRRHAGHAESIKIGDIQAFIQYSRQFSMPITQTANIANIIQSTIASAERVFELLDEEEESAGGVRTRAHDRAGRTRTAMSRCATRQFGYKEDAMLIEDMNIDVQPGQTVAIVGPTGAGKTTLINLLMRFYELNGGSITIDGVDITQLKRGNLRSLFGMVLQDTWLFNGTIRDNIAYGRSGATEEEVVQAAQRGSCRSFHPDAAGRL